MTLTINYLFWLVGIVLLIVGGMILTDKEHPRRLSSGGFWISVRSDFSDWRPDTAFDRRRAGDRDGAGRRVRRRDGGQTQGAVARGPSGQCRAPGQQAVYSRTDDSGRHGRDHPGGKLSDLRRQAPLSTRRTSR
jgi:hypothetical protein